MSLRIVFMGTPDFAVPSLDILVQEGYDVVGVITATDKHGGRGKKQLLESPVKKYAVSKGIPVLQPKNLKSPEFIEELRALNANLQIVVAFRMLPEVVWNMPEIGTFNLHGSLLPRYRGAAPINWAVINGDQETGVTTFFIRHEIDTGDVLLQESLPIGPHETAGEVHDRMMVLGAGVVLKTVKRLEEGNYSLKKQEESQATKAPKIFRETCEIDFSQSVKKVHNFVRGLSPYPAAWTSYDGKQVKVLRARYEETTISESPGTFSSDNKSWIKIAAIDGYLLVDELQMQGRKRMNTRDFLNGYSF
ncbi:MAG: methionyl-tRNA formyltransferase [Mameliella sp.]|nr:methionyl-tRNA formyltransferase [Phaeodactylibacter sp.]